MKYFLLILSIGQMLIIWVLNDKVEKLTHLHYELENTVKIELIWTSEHLKECAFISRKQIEYGVYDFNEKKNRQYNSPLLYDRE